MMAAATGSLMLYLRLVLIAVVLFGACSCSEVAADFGVSIIRQICFRKECTRMDSRARSSDGTVQYRLEFPTIVS